MLILLFNPAEQIKHYLLPRHPPYLTHTDILLLINLLREINPSLTCVPSNWPALVQPDTNQGSQNTIFSLTMKSVFIFYRDIKF